jgi:hypothetical protein
MHIGLFIPCYIEAFFPEVGIATLELLERLGQDVIYPRAQTCCGQPMANSGFNADCAATECLFVRNFSGVDYIVGPSGSCVHHIRDNFGAIEQTDDVKQVRSRTYELVEFLHDVLKVDAFPWARFPHDADLHVNAVAYLAQHPIVLLDPADIVVNLYHAHQRPDFRDTHYASFHTGPSATADIEGVLIHGAQGVRSLSVFPRAR